MKHCIVLGTRPEIIKMSSTIRALVSGGYDYCIIHTNQHYSAEMDSVFFEELDLPVVTVNLHIGSGTHGAQTGKMLEALERVFIEHQPNVVYVQGDTNTVLAGALAATKLGIPVAHVEAGLRSFDRTMPEETNRIVTDHISSLLFAPTIEAKKLLLAEGISEKIISVVGNPIVDAVMENIERSEQSAEKLRQKIESEHFDLLTMHRPANVDNKSTLEEILMTLHEISAASHRPIIFPIHPRTKKQLEMFDLHLPKSIIELPPVGFLELLWLEKHAEYIFTDSGGIQEEACILQKKCLTLRPNTERPETITVGGNLLAGTKRATILAAMEEMTGRDVTWSNPFGNGTTGRDMIAHCEEIFLKT